MDLTALGGATLVALTSTMFFLLVIKAWSAFAQSSSGSRFPQSIMLEAAQRYRDELAKRGREQSIYLASGLMFAVVFSIAYLLRPDELFVDIPRWQHIVVLVVLGVATGFLAYRLTTIMIERRKLFFIRDANMATGHSLQKLTANRNRVFHDVRCGVGTIDSVIVGLHGIYTVSVIARKPGKDNTARLKGDHLIFAGQDTISVKRSGAKSAQLSKEIQKVTAHKLRVRSVIAIPGWEIESQASGDYLVVNERNIAMLTGWRDQKDYLLDEDVEAIHKMLTERCTRFA